jgi:quinol-cytochrome oxidoreductase complex cytochrome b subunit
MRAEVLIFAATLVVCLVLGLLYDAPLKEAANAAIPENPAKAPWYFLGLQELVSYSAFMGGMVIPGIALLGLALIPYLDREKEPVGVYLSGARGKRIAAYSLVFGIGMAMLAVAIPVKYGWLRNWVPDINQLWIILVNPGTLLTLVYMAWSLVVLRTTRSTRMAAIAIFTCFLAGFIVLTYVGSELRGPNWNFYWSHSAWPTH